jgi:predicted nucleic acid-binding Zn ribbon protein
MPERHVGELIGEFFRRGGMLRAVRRAEAVVAWPRIVGPELARFAQARALKNGVLFVDVPDSETAMHLSLQRARILDAYERWLGRREVRDVRFAAGRPAPPPPAARASEPPEPDPSEWRALTAALAPLELPPSVAGPALEAGRAMLRHRRRAREAGWTPCPHCGALSPDPGPCATCARLRDAPRVRRMAQRLTVDADAALPDANDDERTVARALAVELLDERVAELLPQVLASPELRPQLARAARIRIALAEERPVTTVDDVDLERFDARVARVLGRWGGTRPEEGSEP